MVSHSQFWKPACAQNSRHIFIITIQEAVSNVSAYNPV